MEDFEIPKTVEFQILDLLKQILDELQLTNDLLKDLDDTIRNN